MREAEMAGCWLQAMDSATAVSELREAASRVAGALEVVPMKCLAKLGEIWYAVLIVGIFVAASIKAGLARRSGHEAEHHRWDNEPAIVKFGEVLGLILAVLAVVVAVVYCFRS